MFSKVHEYTLAIMTWNLAGGKDYTSIDAVTLITSAYHN